MLKTAECCLNKAEVILNHSKVNIEEVKTLGNIFMLLKPRLGSDLDAKALDLFLQLWTYFEINNDCRRAKCYSNRVLKLMGLFNF